MTPIIGMRIDNIIIILLTLNTFEALLTVVETNNNIEILTHAVRSVLTLISDRILKKNVS